MANDKTLKPSLGIYPDTTDGFYCCFKTRCQNDIECFTIIREIVIRAQESEVRCFEL